jgi:hypothetical protein
MYLKYILILLILIVVSYNIMEINAKREPFLSIGELSIGTLPGLEALDKLNEKLDRLNNEFIGKISNVQQILLDIKNTDDKLLEQRMDSIYKNNGESLLSQGEESIVNIKTKLCGAKEGDNYVVNGLLYDDNNNSQFLNYYNMFQNAYNKDNNDVCSLRRKEKLDQLMGKINSTTDQMLRTFQACT